MGRIILLALVLLSLALLWPGGSNAVPPAGKRAEAPVTIGLDAEIGHKTSTSDDAIRMGIELAIAEIHRFQLILLDP